MKIPKIKNSELTTLATLKDGETFVVCGHLYLRVAKSCNTLDLLVMDDREVPAVDLLDGDFVIFDQSLFVEPVRYGEWIDPQLFHSLILLLIKEYRQ